MENKYPIREFIRFCCDSIPPVNHYLIPFLYRYDVPTFRDMVV